MGVIVIEEVKGKDDMYRVTRQGFGARFVAPKCPRQDFGARFVAPKCPRQGFGATLPFGKVNLTFWSCPSPGI